MDDCTLVKDELVLNEVTEMKVVDSGVVVAALELLVIVEEP